MAGLLPRLFPVPRALETDEILQLMEELREAALRAKAAGFDGVELHAANGYLPEQFLSEGSNQRTDNYGGSLENRARFLLESVAVLNDVWGAGRVAVRISPSGTYGDMHESDPQQTFRYLVSQLIPFQLAYLHIIEPRIVGPEDRQTDHYAEPVASRELRACYPGTIIAAGGFTPEAAENMLKSGDADLIAFGRGANKYDIASGPMAEAVENSTQHWKDADLKATAVYLKSLANDTSAPQPLAADNSQMVNGKAIYADRCSACHVSQGQGVPRLFPQLAAAPLVNAADPTSLIHVVLAGSRAGGTAAAPTAPAMPAFGWNLSDENVADVLTYIRNSWGNAAPSVTAGDVKDLRKTLEK